MRPTEATITANGSMIWNVSRVSGMFARWKGGKPPLIEAKSPTVLVSMPNPYASPKTTTMAVSPPGIAFVILGISQMINIATTTSPTNTYISVPASQAPAASLN